MVKVFISSVQREFAAERREVAEYIRQDAVMRRFFEPFLFEELPARDVSSEQAYLAEVADTNVYLGIFGTDYGYEDAEGISPTEREYDCASARHKYRIVLIKRAEERHPKESALIRKAEQDVVRNKFGSLEELKSAVYAALVHYLVLRGYLYSGPFDAEEGCLSLTGTRKAKRYRSIKVQYQNEEFRTRLKTFTGWTAQIIQHEIDHCNGILI